MLQVLNASGRPQRTLRAPLKMKDNLPESQVEILCEASREGKQKCRHGKRKYGFVFCSLLGFRNIADFIVCLCLLPDALFVLSWWLSLFRSFFCFCESLDLCCAGAVRRSQTFVPITRRSTDLYSPPFCVLYCESLPLCLRLPPRSHFSFSPSPCGCSVGILFYFLSNNTSVICCQV